MGLALPDKWVWDSWYAKEGERWHGFFLQADKSLVDPERRHWHVSHGHAVSRDLSSWDYLGTCFEPADGPAWDDLATWTGSVVEDDRGLWHLFYTGASAAEEGKLQRIGHATSDDLHRWRRVGDGLAVDRGEPYEEYTPGRWHDRAFRDPWVMRDPSGPGWLMYFTARVPDVPDPLGAGAIGFATSPDLLRWTLEPPVFVGAAGQLEVPQVFHRDGRWYCLFCTDAEFWSADALSVIGEPRTGTHYLMASDPRGPWRLAPGPVFDGACSEPRRYAARVLADGGALKLLGFRWFDEPDTPFVGEISDPAIVDTAPDGRLRLGGTA